MSQPTDVTQPMPAFDPDATMESPIVQPVMTLQEAAAAAGRTVPVVLPKPAFDPQRARLAHLHRVLGRILSTASLPTPDRADLHAYGNGIELLIRNDLDGSALVPFVTVFGGTVETSDKDSKWSESGRQRYAELLTVVDGVEVRVWSLTDLPAVEQPVAEPVVEPVAEAEPQHDTAPDAPAETPAEHPEAA